MAQMERRNTLKDGIIMIQTLLIIIFIIVPIFLLLDKVPQELGVLGKAGRWAQGRPDMGRVSIFSDCDWSLKQAPSWSLAHSLFIRSFCLGDSFFLFPPRPTFLAHQEISDPNILNCTLPSPTPVPTLLQDDSKAGMEEDHTYEVRDRIT